MPALAWQPDLPVEVRTAAEPALRRWLALVPGWCYEVRVSWLDTPEQGEDAHMSVAWEYRSAHVTFCPGWLSLAPEDRDAEVGHELLHIVLGPMANWMRDALTAHVADDALRGQLENEWRQRFEGATSDLAFLLRPLLAG